MPGSVSPRIPENTVCWCGAQRDSSSSCSLVYEQSVWPLQLLVNYFCATLWPAPLLWGPEGLQKHIKGLHNLCSRTHSMWLVETLR